MFQVCAPGLLGEFAALTSIDAFPGNLPLQASSFIGRDRELVRVAKALAEARVVTLTGVGGVGKTRLALQAAAEVLPEFREGAWLVELAPVRDPDGVVDAFAAVFGVTARAGQTLEESLAEFFRTKHLLLVVDNCEHLLEAGRGPGGVPRAFLSGVRSWRRVVKVSRSTVSRWCRCRRWRAPARTPISKWLGSDAVRLFVERAARDRSPISP